MVFIWGDAIRLGAVKSDTIFDMRGKEVHPVSTTGTAETSMKKRLTPIIIFFGYDQPILPATTILSFIFIYFFIFQGYRFLNRFRFNKLIIFRQTIQRQENSKGFLELGPKIVKMVNRAVTFSGLIRCPGQKSTRDIILGIFNRSFKGNPFGQICCDG